LQKIYHLETMKKSLSPLFVFFIVSCFVFVPTAMYGQGPSGPGNEEEIIILPKPKPKSVFTTPIEAWYHSLTQTIHFYTAYPLGTLQVRIENEDMKEVLDVEVDGDQPNISLKLPLLPSGVYQLYVKNDLLYESGTFRKK